MKDIKKENYSGHLYRKQTRQNFTVLLEVVSLVVCWTFALIIFFAIHVDYMCSIGPLKCRWLKGYICYPFHYYQIGSISLSHCWYILPWLCVWGGCTITFCHLGYKQIYISGTLGLCFDYWRLTPRKCVFTGIHVRGCVSERLDSSYSVSYRQSPGPLFTKKTPSYGYRDPHYIPKTVWRPSQVYNILIRRHLLSE